MMKRSWIILALAAALMALLAGSCSRMMEQDIPVPGGLPEGTPITMRLDFGAGDLINLAVSTKAEATPADEERIHDLYVMIFCDGEGEGHVNRGQKIYGRYFSYEHLAASLAALDASPNEGWWAENRTIPDAEHPERDILKTRGAVKISTKVCSSAKLVVIANVDNGICRLGNESGFENDILDYLNGIRTWEQLQKTQVKLIQDVVHRKDLFLMMGMPEDGSGNPRNVNTGEMVWGSTSPSVSYNSSYQVKLRAVDAKVKFKVRVNDEYISAAKAMYWEVDKTPDRCYLFSDYAPAGYPAGTPPVGTVYFNTEQAYFEGTETQDGSQWHVFSFYMLESRFAAKASASQYHDRERKTKIATDKDGYEGPQEQRDDNLFVENGEWIYAMPNAPYVKFDMVLTLTPAGVTALGGNVEHALTSDTVFTVHLGDFSNQGLDDYNTYRSTCYTYNITIVNSGSIYAEVMLDRENQPGQEGYLLLTDDEIVNADSHYEYHAITFAYDPETTPEKFSWYVKTPFTSKVGGGPVKGTRVVGGKTYPTYDPHDTDGTLLDYRWVKFSINETDPTTGYSTHRMAYPGDSAYTDYKDWGVGEHGPWDDTPHPQLMDISQLIQYIFQETDKERESEGSSDFKLDTQTGVKVIRATIFIDEFYYETDPRSESEDPQPDPNLWRQFVNAQPREMHILSKTVQSRDQMSDVIESSHSVIQQSIQTIYNVFEPDLRSIWGCEHLDEIKYTTVDGLPQSTPAGNWKYWPDGCSDSERKGANDNVGKENGRLNSAYIWGLSNSAGSYYLVGGQAKRYWKHFLKYEVNNSVPELRDDTESDTYGDDGTTHKYRGMAWSCLTRNRDNNGNGRIDEEEVRWYLASSQQLAGIWVGTESLSSSARLYQPAEGQWRAHVVSSTNKLVSWAEEGGGATAIEHDWEGSESAYHTWDTEEEATKGESVRCIRNIGTYDGPGGVTDISYAPVTVIPDKYFTLERHSKEPLDDYDCSVGDGADNDDYFIFYFNRLNTNSIREYSPGELPYHDQMSLNNRVYKMMVTQPLSLDMPAYSEKLGEINNKVTQSGHNDYCPEGYRFPNHTEWLLMSLYLPGNYLQKGKDGESYSNVYPSRTYYDRGYYGSLRSDTEPWSTEKGKVGWLFSGIGTNAKMHCSPYNETIKRSRCVKDVDQTGIISGKIAVEGNVIYPGDKIPIDFKFSSTASTFTDATLTLWYTKNGFRTPYDLTSHMKAPTGLQYKGTQDVLMPTLAELGLDAAGLPYDMSLEVEFHNLNNSSGSHELAVSMENPLSCTVTPDEHFYPADTEGGRFAYSFSSAAHNVDLSSVTITLTYTDQNGQEQSIPITGITPSGKKYSGSKTVSMPTLSEMGLNTLGFNLNRTMTLNVSVTGTNGLTAAASSPVTLVSHLAGSSVQFPTEYDEDDGIPVDVIARTVNNHASVSSARFYWKRSGDAEYHEGPALSGAGTSNMSTRTFVNTIIDDELSESNKGKFYFYLTASCSDGTSIRSDVWSMDVLYYGKCWNPGPWDSNSTVSQINQKWLRESVTGLDFARGDFVDAYMDVSNCVYIRKDGTADNDIGMDNLISLGDSNSTLEWKAGNILFYYPAHSPSEAPGQDKLQIGILHYGYSTIARVRPYTLDDHVLTVRLEKDNLLVNGEEPDWSLDYTAADGKPAVQRAGENTVPRTRGTISHITGESTIKIGSIEGKHRSRATYKYVRVIRKETTSP